jgi:pantoate--beta-alanine ligase
METIETIDAARQAVRQARDSHMTVGLVLTMGALHNGHVSLIQAARQQCDYVVVSIFVNPTQFGPNEDFDAYPRPLETDVSVCAEQGVDMIFVPSVDQVYGSRCLTWVDVEQLTEGLCGQFRPGHFRGVTTICAKLFNIILPDKAFFGQKDVQQAIVIRKMVEDLNMPLQIVVCPTVREPDGLAMSSRNQYLNKDERQQAAALYQSLQRCRELVSHGMRESAALIGVIKEILSQQPDIDIQYVSIVDIESLRPLAHIADRALVAVAARLGPARLIDNIVVDLSGSQDII